MSKKDKNPLVLSKEEFKKRYVDPAMARLAHDYLCHPDRLSADDRAFLSYVPDKPELECDGDCEAFIAGAHAL